MVKPHCSNFRIITVLFALLEHLGSLRCVALFHSYRPTVTLVFQNCTKVQYLDLSHNNFGQISGEVLGPAIAENTCIKELDLSWNCFRRKGAVAIAQGIKVSLKRATLTGNMSYAICEQQKHKSAWEFAQSDQCLCYWLPKKHNTSRCYIRNSKTLDSFYS